MLGGEDRRTLFADDRARLDREGRVGDARRPDRGGGRRRARRRPPLGPSRGRAPRRREAGRRSARSSPWRPPSCRCAGTRRAAAIALGEEHDAQAGPVTVQLDELERVCRATVSGSPAKVKVWTMRDPGTISWKLPKNRYSLPSSSRLRVPVGPAGAAVPVVDRASRADAARATGTTSSGSTWARNIVGGRMVELRRGAKQREDGSTVSESSVVRVHQSVTSSCRGTPRAPLVEAESRTSSSLR